MFTRGRTNPTHRPLPFVKLQKLTPTQFNQEYQPLANLLTGFARKLTQNEEDAKDLVQETLLRAFKNRHSFRLGSNFKSWMTTIMHNTFISGCRKRANFVKWQRRNEGRETPFSIQDRSGEAFTNLALSEMNSLLDEIGEGFSRPFLLYYTGYRYKEIAEQMDLPLGTVKSRIFFARKKLIHIIESQEMRLSA